MERKVVRWKDVAVVFDGKSPMLIKIQSLRKWISVERLYEVCRNPKTGEYEPSSWPQFVAAGIPKATLSRLLNELIKEECVQAQLKVDPATGKRETFYIVIKPWQSLMSYRAARASMKTSDGKNIDLGIVMGRWTCKTAYRKPWFKFGRGEKALLQERVKKTMGTAT